MAKEIRRVEFQKSTESKLEFEIVLLQQLIEQYGEYLNTHERLNFHLLIYFTKGEGKHYIDFEEYTYKPGTILFLSRGRIQKYSVNKKARGYLILFTDQFLLKDKTDSEMFSNFYLFNNYLSSPKVQLAEKNKLKFDNILAELKEQFSTSLDFAKTAILRSILRVLLFEIERIKRPAVENVAINRDTLLFNKFKQLLEDNFSSKRNVSFYANKLCISEKKLSLATHGFLGSSAKTIINERTILEIKRRLSHTLDPIKEIGYDLNFDDPTNFIKFFKRYTNLTPKQFRNENS